MRNYKKERCSDLHGSYNNILDLKVTRTNQSSGAKWYKEANEIAYSLGKLAGFSNPIRRVQVGAGILAALSPQTEWGDNIHMAHMVVGGGTATGQTTVNNEKAFKILSGEHPLEVLGGLKVVPFYKAIVSPLGDNTPVIDRHSAAVYMGRPLSERELGFLASPVINRRIAGAYIRAALHQGVHPNTLQAQSWLQWRQNKGITRRVGGQQKEVYTKR